MVIFCGFCYSKSLAELKTEVVNLLKTNPMLQVIFTDNTNDLSFFQNELRNITVFDEGEHFVDPRFYPPLNDVTDGATMDAYELPHKVHRPPAEGKVLYMY